MKENLSLYHIFYIVGKTGNISLAAKELYISQPAVSRAIQRLESNLDTRLFKRSSRGVFLTSDGRILFEKIRAAFELVSEGEKAILHNHSRNIPHLRLGTSTTLCRYVLLPRLKPYIAAHPHVRISISCQDTYQTLRLLEEEKIDVGLIGKPQKLHACFFRPIMNVNDIFVATTQYLTAQEQLYPGEPLSHNAVFMMLDEENISRQTINSCLKEHRMEPVHILEVSTMDLLIQFAETGLGIAGVVRQFVEKELKKGILSEVPLGFRFPERELGFVCRKKEENFPLLQYFFTEN
nr:LysR family transcriptional regulator [uncultured Blautia sp.]